MSDIHQDELRLRVTEAMELHGLSQNQLAHQSGVNQGIISRFLRGGGLSEDNASKLDAHLTELGEAPVPTSDEARKGIRLYRYLTKLHEEGATLVVRYPDGTELPIVVLW